MGSTAAPAGWGGWPRRWGLDRHGGHLDGGMGLHNAGKGFSHRDGGLHDGDCAFRRGGGGLRLCRRRLAFRSRPLRRRSPRRLGGPGRNASRALGDRHRFGDRQRLGGSGGLGDRGTLLGGPARGRLGLGCRCLGCRFASRGALAGRGLPCRRPGRWCFRRRRCCCCSRDYRCGDFGFYGWRRRLTPACPSCRRRWFRRSGVGIVDHITSSLLRGEAVHRWGLSRRPPPVHPGWPARIGGRSLSTGSENP